MMGTMTAADGGARAALGSSNVITLVGSAIVSDLHDTLNRLVL